MPSTASDGIHLPFQPPLLIAVLIKLTCSPVSHMVTFDRTVIFSSYSLTGEITLSWDGVEVEVMAF